MTPEVTTALLTGLTLILIAAVIHLTISWHDRKRWEARFQAQADSVGWDIESIEWHGRYDVTVTLTEREGTTDAGA